MATDQGVTLILIGSAFGQLLIANMLGRESNWIEAMRLLFIGGGGLSFIVALGYAASQMVAPYQDIVEFIVAFLVVSFILLIFIAGVTWVVNIFKGMVKEVESAKL